jgi:nicotinamidase-related amidase
MKALLNIDYTYDFVAKDGKLTAGEPAQKLHDCIVNVTREFIVNGDYTIFAIDAHEEDDKYHPETKLFPPHNIIGTSGRDLYGELETLYQENKEKKNIYYTDKTRYSAFAGTDVEQRLRARGITEIHLVGVCTDICILHTAIDAYNKGFNIVIHKDGVSSFNHDAHEVALQHFKNSLGAEII